MSTVFELGVTDCGSMSVVSVAGEAREVWNKLPQLAKPRATEGVDSQNLGIGDMTLIDHLLKLPVG